MRGTRGQGPAAAGNLSIVSSAQHGAVELSLHGELDLAGVWLFDDAVARAVQGGAGRIVLDLGPLSFVDLAGIRALLEARNMCLATGIQCRVAGWPSPQVVRTLALVQADTRLGFPRRESGPTPPGAPRWHQRPPRNR